MDEPLFGSPIIDMAICVALGIAPIAAAWAVVGLGMLWGRGDRQSDRSDHPCP